MAAFRAAIAALKAAALNPSPIFFMLLHPTPPVARTTLK
jgi:hypothetical protein